MNIVAIVGILLVGFLVAAVIAALPMFLLWRWQKKTPLVPRLTPHKNSPFRTERAVALYEL